MRERITRVVNRAKYAGIGGAVGGAVGGLFSARAASTGAGIGAFVGAVLGEKWTEAAPVVKRARGKAEEERARATPMVERAKSEWGRSIPIVGRGKGDESTSE